MIILSRVYQYRHKCRWTMSFRVENEPAIDSWRYRYDIKTRSTNDVVTSQLSSSIARNDVVKISFRPRFGIVCLQGAVQYISDWHNVRHKPRGIRRKTENRKIIININLFCWQNWSIEWILFFDNLYQKCFAELPINIYQFLQDWVYCPPPPGNNMWCPWWASNIRTTGSTPLLMDTVCVLLISYTN